MRFTVQRTDLIYSPTEYNASRPLTQCVEPGVNARYHSPGQASWRHLLPLTPRQVSSVVQTAHYEMIWNGDAGAHGCQRASVDYPRGGSLSEIVLLPWSPDKTLDLKAGTSRLLCLCHCRNEFQMKSFIGEFRHKHWRDHTSRLVL
jgi:hypothetical protein